MDSQIKKKLDSFFTSFNSKKYKKGEILIRAENPHAVFYLKSGTVKQYVISKKGDEIVVNIFKPISFFPMSWAINDTDNTYYYEATSDVETYLARKEDVLQFLRTNPDALLNLMSRVYRGTDGLLTRMIHLMSGNAYPRLITELLIQVKRFGQVDQKTGAVTIKLFEKDIAADSGMTRETVSREMKVLKNKKLVSLKNSLLTIPSIKELEEELEDY